MESETNCLEGPSNEQPENNDTDLAEEPKTADLTEEQPTMSKRQMKRKMRYEAKAEERKQKRIVEKERKKAKRKADKEAGNYEALKKPKINQMSTSKCPIQVAVDMSYQKYMNEDLLRKTIVQLNFSYGVNRRAENPLQYHIANLSGATKTKFDSFAGYSDWDVYMHEESVAEIWPADDVVYLTSDSPNVLVDLDPKKVYIIGGLLDHNRHPGASLAKAQVNKFGHARLPIEEFVKLQTRKVLTINQVFEIILRFWETKDWEKAFFSVIPKRKGMEKLDEAEKKDLPANQPTAAEETQTIEILDDETQKDETVTE